MLRQGCWLSRTVEEDAAEAKEPDNKQVARSFIYNYCFSLFSPEKSFCSLFSESSPAKPHPRQANSTSRGEAFTPKLSTALVRLFLTHLSKETI